MSLNLIRASVEQKNILENLMQFYVYDFSEYVELDVNNDGLFQDYLHLNEYWQGSNNHFAYLFKKQETLIGFALVRFIESDKKSHFSIAEFFIMKRYRLQGFGKAMAMRLFDLHKGSWLVYQKENNKPAQTFWRTVINEYSNGCFTARSADGKKILEFENN